MYYSNSLFCTVEPRRPGLERMELCWTAQASAAATGALTKAVRTSKGGASSITLETADEHLCYLRDFKVLK